MKKVLIECLDLLRKERIKRSNIAREYGIQFNYFYDFNEEAAISLIARNLFLMNKKVKRKEDEIKQEIREWLEGGCLMDIGKKTYNVENSKDFINFFINH